MKASKLTPLMRQYWQVKSQHPDKIVLFRMGDFFEMFYEDAEKAAPILNIVLTSRNKKHSDSVKMCGLPHHSIAGAVGKLLNAGFKVAICDQVEPVSQAKGLVRREVTRILTPGMVYDPESLDQLSANYLCSLDDSSVSFVDLTTGTSFFYQVSDRARQEQLIHLLHPVELVLSPNQKEKYFSDKQWEEYHQTVFDYHVDNSLDDSSSHHSFPLVDLPVSVQRLKKYIETQQGVLSLKTVQPFQKREFEQHMQISSTVHEHLEVFKSYEGEKTASLFYAVNRTKTPCGARLLKSRIQTPSCNRKEIEKRWNAVDEWLKNPEAIRQVRDILFKVGDIERRLGKITHPQCHGRDFLGLATSLHNSLSALRLCSVLPIPEDTAIIVQNLSHEITSTIREDAPVNNQQGHIIQKGVSEELDKLIEDSDSRQSSLRRLEDQERMQTGIPSLKIRYNSVFGYYIEVTKVHAKKIPNHYIRKQTLTQAERYTTEKLQAIEEQILSARVRRIEMELQIFENLKQKIINMLPDLFYLSRLICEVDVNVSWAWLSVERSYVRPCFSQDVQLVLVNSRHPVVEQKLVKAFVPNTIRMKAGECLLLTGPNMAGKSTLMRQVALTVILAQAGGFVPAEQAFLPLFKKIFTRIGASDSLSKGLSTFMMEMKESVEILKNADEHSLVILDEIGRGTATYDGMSLAQAILEYLVTKKKSLIFFATHYHELTTLSKNLSQVRNAHINVKEENGVVDFLYTLASGASAQSYGVHVARLAGFPKEVLTRAEKLLKDRESNASASVTKSTQHPPSSPTKDHRQSLIQEISSYPLMEKSPLDTVEAVSAWKKDIQEKL